MAIVRTLAEVKGVVDVINSRKTGLRLRGADEWLNFGRECEYIDRPEAGQRVVMQVESDKWIMRYEVDATATTNTGPQPSSGSSYGRPEPDERQIQIARAVALKAAIDYYVADRPEIESLLVTAQIMEQWLLRRDDDIL